MGEKESDRQTKQKISPLHGSQQLLIDPLLLVFAVVRVPQNRECNGLMYVWPRWECLVPPLGETSLKPSLAADSGSVAAQGLRNESGGVLGVFDGFMVVYDPSSDAPHLNAPWMWLSQGG